MFFRLVLVPACLCQLLQRVGTLDSAKGFTVCGKKELKKSGSIAFMLPPAQFH